MIDLNVGVNNKKQLNILKKCNINKIFCGYIDNALSKKWKEDFLTINKRGKGASICGKTNFKNFALEAEKQKINVYVTFNSLYIPEQYDWILDAIKYVSSFKSVSGIIVNDIGLLLRLKQINYSKEIVISTGGTTFNSSTVSFYKQFGIKRVILDRQLKTNEIISILDNHKDMQFELFLFLANCTFVDGFCSMFHQLNTTKGYGHVTCAYINDLRAAKKYKLIKRENSNKNYNIEFMQKDNYPFLGCNLCAVKNLSKYSDRITYKLVTRSNYAHEFDRLQEHLQKIQEIDEKISNIKDLFKIIFGCECNEKFGCYISPKIV